MQGRSVTYKSYARYKNLFLAKVLRARQNYCPCTILSKLYSWMRSVFSSCNGKNIYYKCRDFMVILRERFLARKCLMSSGLRSFLKAARDETVPLHRPRQINLQTLQTGGFHHFSCNKIIGGGRTASFQHTEAVFPKIESPFADHFRKGLIKDGQAGGRWVSIVIATGSSSDISGRVQTDSKSV